MPVASRRTLLKWYVYFESASKPTNSQYSQNLELYKLLFLKFVLKDINLRYNFFLNRVNPTNSF